jgi:hypothetical protein
MKPVPGVTRVTIKKSKNVSAFGGWATQPLCKRMICVCALASTLPPCLLAARRFCL